MAVKLKGKDVSKWNPTYNGEIAKKQKDSFVIIRAGYGRQKNVDSRFEQHYRSAMAAGLSVGAYWFSYATCAEEAIAEAYHFLELVKDKRMEFPLVYDYEADSLVTMPDGKLRPDVANECCKAFCSILENEGYYAMFYTNKYWYNTVWDDETKKRFGCWLAHYGTEKDLPFKPQIWQYSNSVRMNYGTFDGDYAFIDFPELLKKRGLNHLS